MASPSLRRSVQVLAWLGAGCLGPLACSSDPASSTGVTHPTMIEVSPADFLGARACANEPGAARRYVATLFDVTEQAGGAGSDSPGAAGMGSGGAPAVEVEAPHECGGFQLPSSEPVACTTSVGFGFVVSGRRYCAEIDAYDTDQLEPRGSGTRQMVASDPDDDEPPAADAPSVVPNWTTTCSGATASFASIVPMLGCEPLSDQPDPAAPGALRVESATLLTGGLTCGSEPGQVERLVVSLELDDYMGARKLEIACGEAAVYEGLPTAARLSLYVTAFEANSTQVLAGAECHALAKPGTQVVAQCASLSQVGTLRVDVPAALEDLGLACDATVTDVVLEIEGLADDDENKPQRLPPPDCLEPFDHGFAAGRVGRVTLTVTPASGEPQSLSCFNVIEPGRLVVAECTP